MLVKTSDLSSRSKLFSVYESLVAERHCAVILAKSAIATVDYRTYDEARSTYRKFNDIIKDHFEDLDAEEFPQYSVKQYLDDLDEQYKSMNDLEVVFSDGSYVDDSVDVPF